MIQPIRSLCVFLCVAPLFLVSDAQFLDTGAASLGSAPVGFISRVGVSGNRENFASLGNAPVGVYQRQQYHQPWYQVPRMPIVEVYPVKPACRLPGPCRDQVVKAVRPVRPPPARPHYKPVVRPPVRPVVRPPVRPGVRPPKRPISPYVIRKPKTYRPRPKPGGRNTGSGLLLGVLAGAG